MKVKQLIELLRQFDPERNVWVIYDTFQAFPADDFAPIGKRDADKAENYDGDEQPAAGDIAMIVG